MVDILFHILNFLLLCFTLRYIIRTYFYERIMQTMIMTQAAYANAVKRGEQLRKQEQSLIRAYYHQNYRYEELSRKTELWNHKIDSNYQLHMKEREEIMQKLEQRDFIKQKNIQSLQLCRQIIKEVAAQTKEDILTYFNSEKGRAYNHQLIQRITKGPYVQQ